MSLLIAYLPGLVRRAAGSSLGAKALEQALEHAVVGVPAGQQPVLRRFLSLVTLNVNAVDADTRGRWIRQAFALACDTDRFESEFAAFPADVDLEDKALLLGWLAMMQVYLDARSVGFPGGESRAARMRDLLQWQFEELHACLLPEMSTQQLRSNFVDAGLLTV